MTGTTMARQRTGAQAQPRARGTALTDALHAEWTKLRTVPGPSWLLLAAAVLTVTVSTAAVGATHCPASMQCPVDTTKLSLTGIHLGSCCPARRWARSSPAGRLDGRRRAGAARTPDAQTPGYSFRRSGLGVGW